MSLINTVAKVAVGFAMAKGVEAVRSRGGIGAVLEELQGAATNQAGSMGGLDDLLGQLAGGQGQGGGLGDLLGQLTGGGTGAAMASAGGLAGLGGLLGGLAGATGGNAGALQALLNQDNPAEEPDENDIAELMLRAMLYAARADGDIDAEEEAKLLGALREGDPSDMEHVKSILKEPVNVSTIVNATPKGLETQVYTMSLNAISPDNQSEAQYLHDLAQGLGIGPSTVNDIHDSLSVTRIYQ